MLPSPHRALALAFLFPVLVALQVAADTLPQETGSGLVPDPAIRYGRLENGMRYALLANDTPPQEAALRLAFDTGSLMEADDQQGLAHFVEHMAFNGSENVPEGEMVKILERYGLAFGPDTNAGTGLDQTVYMLDLPEVSDEVLGQGLFLLREVAGNLSLEEGAIDRERGVVVSELRVRNTPGYRALKAQLAFLGPEARFSRRLPGGLPEIIRTAPAERLRDYYDRYYRPERALLVVVGDVDLDAVEARIRSLFGDWRGRGAPGDDPDLGAIVPGEARAEVFVDPELPANVTINAVKPYEAVEDSRETRRRALLENLGYGVVNRRFATLARSEEAPFFSAAASYSSLFDTAEVASVSIGARPGQWREALALGERTLRRALTHGFTRAELDEQIANLRTRLENAARSAATRQSVALAGAIVSAALAGDVLQHPSEDLALFEAQVADVTPQQVLAAIRSHWRGVEPLVFVTSPEPLEGGAPAVLAALEASAQEPVAPPEETEDRAFAYTDFGPPGKVVERREVEDLGLSLLRFDNGVMLNLKPTDFEEDRIRLQVRVGSGQLGMSRELAGLNYLVTLGFGNMGLEAHSTDELQRLLAGRSVNLQLSLGEDSLRMGNTTTPRDLLLQLQVWAAALTAPGYRPEGLAQFRRTIEGVYDTLDSTPGGVLQLRGAELLHGGDPRFGMPPREQLLGLDLDDLRGFVEAQLDAGAIEVSAVGDFEPDTLIAAVAATLGALPERRATPRRPEDVVSFPAPGGERLRHSGTPEQAMAAVYWPTTDAEDPALVQQLNLLEAVLQLRLTDKLREELGATYSPRAVSPQSLVYDGYGYLGVLSEVDAGQVDEVVTLLQEVAAGLVAAPVDGDELRRARQPLLERQERLLESNAYWQGVIGQAQSRPGYLDRHRRAREHLQAADAARLQALARLYLDPAKAYVLRVLPAAG